MLRITATHRSVEKTTEIPDEFAPAFRSFVEEMRNELGERLSGIHRYEKEDALTRAMAAVGAFAALINAIIPEGDKDYE